MVAWRCSRHWTTIQIRRASAVRLPGEPRDPRTGREWFSLILRLLITTLLLAMVVALLIAILASR
jgi:hypothetical protein